MVENNKHFIKKGYQRNCVFKWATSWKNLFLPHANNKGADQTARISVFVVRCMDKTIPLVSISEILSLYLASVAEKAGLSLL